LEIARRIEAVAFNNPTARVISHKIAKCARAENVWTGEDLHNEHGECYSATGTLWRCNERLCPNCLTAHSRRGRKRARTALETLTPTKSERLWFVTLTMPTVAAIDSPLLLTLSVTARAWRLFSQRSWWRQMVRAGVKGVEFTLGDERKRSESNRSWSADLDGYHVHLHLVILSPWLPSKTLREEWTECLKNAWDEVGITRGVNTRDGLAVCHIKAVTKHNFDGVLCEVAKYITKSESWLSIPESQLVEVASVTRWPRMFELLGECRGEASPKQRTIATIGRRGDGAVAVLDRIAALRSDGDVSDINLARQASAELYVLLELQPETRAAIETRTRYLDTPHVSAARDGPLLVRHRARSLRDVGIELLTAGRVAEWRELLTEKVSQVQDFRRAQLVRGFPFAKFTSLDGRSWPRRHATSRPLSATLPVDAGD
jgi:Replication protein